MAAAILPYLAGKHGCRSLAQINKYESVQHVGEIRGHVEFQQRGVQFQLMAVARFPPQNGQCPATAGRADRWIFDSPKLRKNGPAPRRALDNPEMAAVKGSATESRASANFSRTFGSPRIWSRATLAALLHPSPARAGRAVARSSGWDTRHRSARATLLQVSCLTVLKRLPLRIDGKNTPAPWPFPTPSSAPVAIDPVTRRARHRRMDNIPAIPLGTLQFEIRSRPPGFDSVR